MSASIKNQVTIALQSVEGYSKAVTHLRTLAASMEREEFRVMALPVVAAFYKVAPVESTRGGLMLEKDSKAATYLKRLVRDVFPGAATAGRAEAKRVRLSAGELSLAQQLSTLDSTRLAAIIKRAKELRG